MQFKIFLSTAGVLSTLALLFKIGLTYGFMPVVLYYWGPYMWTNAWLVMYTWLQVSPHAAAVHVGNAI